MVRYLDPAYNEKRLWVIAKELQITTKFISNTIELMKRKARAILMLQEREGLDEIGPRRPP